MAPCMSMALLFGSLRLARCACATDTPGAENSYYLVLQWPVSTSVSLISQCSRRFGRCCHHADRTPLLPLRSRPAANLLRANTTVSGSRIARAPFAAHGGPRFGLSPLPTLDQAPTDTSE